MSRIQETLPKQQKKKKKKNEASNSQPLYEEYLHKYERKRKHSPPARLPYHWSIVMATITCLQQQLEKNASFLEELEENLMFFFVQNGLWLWPPCDSYWT